MRACGAVRAAPIASSLTATLADGDPGGGGAAEGGGDCDGHGEAGAATRALPQELLTHVLALLSVNERCRASAACRRWRRAAFDEPLSAQLDLHVVAGMTAAEVALKCRGGRPPGAPAPPPASASGPGAAPGAGRALRRLEALSIDFPGEDADVVGMVYSALPPRRRGVREVRLRGALSCPGSFPLLDLRLHCHGRLERVEACLELRAPGDLALLPALRLASVLAFEPEAGGEAAAAAAVEAAAAAGLRCASLHLGRASSGAAFPLPRAAARLLEPAASPARAPPPRPPPRSLATADLSECRLAPALRPAPLLAALLALPAPARVSASLLYPAQWTRGDFAALFEGALASGRPQRALLSLEDPGRFFAAPAAAEPYAAFRAALERALEEAAAARRAPAADAGQPPWARVASSQIT
eukprot:tig00021254_g19736.t1